MSNHPRILAPYKFWIDFSLFCFGAALVYMGLVAIIDGFEHPNMQPLQHWARLPQTIFLDFSIHGK